MTLPRDILGAEGNIVKKVPPPPILTLKPTARILPISTNNSCDLNGQININSPSMHFYNNQNRNNQNNGLFGSPRENSAVFTDLLDLSEDIATANIKTKISQFEYLASRNFDRCPKFPVFPEKDFPRGNKCAVKKAANGCQNDFFNEKCAVNSFDLVEEDPEHVERKRLDEILTICAEYEKHAQLEKSTKFSPNRIKTNGSLPRDLRTINTSPDQQQAPSSNSPQIGRYQLEVSPFTFDVPPNSASSINVKQRTVFDFNNIPRDVSIKDQFTDLDLLSEQLKKTCAIDYVPNRNRIKTTMMTPYQDGHSNSPYSTPQSPQFSHFPNRFNNEIPSQCNKQLSSPVIQMSNVSTPLNVGSFKYLTLPKDTKLVSQFGGDNKFNPSDAENLIAMRKDMERAMIGLRAKLSENDSCYEEVVREFELERALLVAEYKSRLTEKRNLQSRQQIYLQKVQQIENIITETQLSKDNDQILCGDKLSNAQKIVRDIEVHLNALKTKKESGDYQLTFDKYLLAQEVLDNERKTFEDLEFHHLEKEADLLASKEELQRELRDLNVKIEELNVCLKDLKSQLDHLTHAHTITHTQLERNRQQLHMRVEETRNHLKRIDLDMNTNTHSANKTRARHCSVKCTKDMTKQVASNVRDVDVDYNNYSSGVNSDTEGDEGDDDSDGGSTRSSGSYVLRVVKQNDLGVGGVMTQSVNEALLRADGVAGGLFGRGDGEFRPLEKKTPSQGDIDRICKVTSSSPMNIIDDSMNLGKKTIESLLEIERNRHIHLAETGSEVIENERRRVSELKQRAQEEVRNEWARRKPEFSSTLNSTEQQNSTNISDDENNTKGRNSSDNSVTTTKEMDLDSPSSSAGNFKRNSSKDKQRPLTRYLPIKSADLDLRQHIISAGHQVILCPYVSINSSICKGFLHKKRSKFNNWSRRWFVFDRTKRSLVYYTDKNEKKTRGGTYFQAIQDVYLDHSNGIKSPSPHLTFVMKTQQRIFYLMAPSAEAMRIWVDVIFTGAEGYCGFGQNF